MGAAERQFVVAAGAAIRSGRRGRRGVEGRGAAGRGGRAAVFVGGPRSGSL